ncbi:diguanylate cyclase [Pseudoxanthomonas sp. 22568]|uniref:GGDEF domain-containing protein n=1 Tax=Pseudoxanthomonas sp. 22568 TaxID=3453945 RepID=UPI003F83FC29
MAYLIMLLYVAAHACAIGLSAAAPMASFPFLVAAPAIAAASCAVRMRRTRRWDQNWAAVGFAMLLWTSGMFMAMWQVRTGSPAAGTASLLLYVLYGVPLTFAIASVGREAWYLRLIDAVLALALGVLYAMRTATLAADQDIGSPGFLDLRMMLDLENLFIAVFAVTRLVTATASRTRAFFRALSCFAVAYLLVAVAINHFFADVDFGHWADLIIPLPFLWLAVLAWKVTAAEPVRIYPPRRSHLVRAGSHLFLPLTLMLISALVVQAQPLLGIVGFVLATLGAGIRGVLLQIQTYEERDYFDALSRIDGLTRIPNRRHFEETMEREWRRSMRSGDSLALLLIDIDHFKQLNDTYGHPEGDRILQAVAHALAGCASRSSDTVARYGGEEFAALLPSISRAGALNVATAMREAIEQLALPSPTPEGRVTVSIGVGFIAAVQGGRAHEVLTEADEALYQAKAEGRNRVRERGAR